MKITCPHCKEEMNAEICSDIGGDNRFTLNILLEEGRMLGSKTLGETIKEIGQLMEASAKSLGGKVNCLVEKISVEGNKISVGYLIASAKSSKSQGQL
jgi:hypothetical protein